MPMHYRYKKPANFINGSAKYDDPNDKEAPLWKILLLVILVIALGFAILVGAFLWLNHIFSK
jgi:hypothetical protein